MSKKEKIKEFVKEHKREILFTLTIFTSIGVICCHQQKLFKLDRQAKLDIAALNGLGDLCTKAVVSGEEVSKVLKNNYLGKKVILKIAEFKD